MTGSGLELAPVEDEANHVEPQSPHLREVVAGAGGGGLVIGGLGRFDLAQRRLGDPTSAAGHFPS